MQYSFLTLLCESRLIPSRPSLDDWHEERLRQVAYLYFLALRILLGEEKTKKWAIKYCEKVVEHNDFGSWRGDGNDFYVLLYALSSDEAFSEYRGKVSVPAIRDWFHHLHDNELDQSTQALFNRLDAMFKISNSSLKSTRRAIMHWTENDSRTKRDLISKVIQKLKNLAPKSELLTHLERVSDDDDDDDIKESASSGSTGAASIATAVGGLGAGFAPNQTWRSIYGGKAKKPVVIKRVPEPTPKS